MKRSAVPDVIWWISVALGVLGVLMHQNIIYIAQINSFWTVTVALGLLALGSILK